MDKLTCKILQRLDNVSAEELGQLFPEPSCTAGLLSLLQEAGIDGFNLQCIVVSKNGAAILLLPLFETRFDLSSFVEGWVKLLLKAGGFVIPSIFQPRVLGVGSLEGGWSEIGVDPRIDGETRTAAYTMALATLQALAAKLKSDILAFYNFNRFAILPEEAFKQFNRLPYRSCARLLINFNSIEEYLSLLSRGARKGMRRKMRVSPQVRVIRSRSITSDLDRIYALYLETVARGPMALGRHNRLFFEKICARVPGAEYTLYYVQEELVAFNLLIVKPEAMMDLFFCMDYVLGCKYNLYALSWLENIRICLERKIPFYDAGQGTEKTKSRMGATFIPSYILFKHRLALFDRLLMWPQTLTGTFLSRLRFWPAASAAATPKN